jgi:hypothetical protein
MKPSRILIWELAQNFPPLVAFLMAAWLWQEQQPVQALFWILAGGLSGALLGRLTQFKITARLQPESITVTNIAILTSVMLLCVIYVMSEVAWSNWRVDLVIGIITGLLWPFFPLSTRAARFSRRDWFRRALPLSVAVPLLLGAVRWLAGSSLLLTLIGAILITVGLTLFLHLYGRLFLAPRQDIPFLRPE